MRASRLYRHLLLPAATLMVASCGEAGGSLDVGLDIRMSGLEGDEILQFVLLSDRTRDGEDLACEDVVERCIGDQPGLRVHSLDTPSGMQCAYRVPLDPEAATSSDGQPVSVPGIPTGTGYLLVVEVARPATRGEERVGAGCIPVERISKGTNPPPSSPVDVRQATACLPTLEEC